MIEEDRHPESRPQIVIVETAISRIILDSSPNAKKVNPKDIKIIKQPDKRII
ncbi:non-ribosomal peptide synthetase modules and related proteins [Candidatus Scalindua japonica]|uniref:Non-ribosomal peptide synthetase modules and related proteins n=1 Tax=Candidatus Scalindua japonica TaxID=1284222 RepID=A0A286U1F6_9BACT|nr:non-ribosomal peptide synthetase modules and related proteins [Candidatus Scalindua japonica]